MVDTNSGSDSETLEPEPEISNLAKLSLLCIVSDHMEGKCSDLLPLRHAYSEKRDDGLVLWDLERMATDMTSTLSTWDGVSYDGLNEKVNNRDDITMAILKALVSNGKCADTITTHGRTALQVTALAGDLEYCKELIEKGAKVTAENEDGETALTLVKKWHNQPKDLSHIIKYLETIIPSALR